MTNPEIIQKIRSVNYALQNLEVKGRDNLDILLGSMQALDQVAAALSKMPQPEPKIEIVPVPAEEAPEA